MQCCPKTMIVSTVLLYICTIIVSWDRIDAKMGWVCLHFSVTLCATSEYTVRFNVIFRIQYKSPLVYRIEFSSDKQLSADNTQRCKHSSTLVKRILKTTERLLANVSLTKHNQINPCNLFCNVRLLPPIDGVKVPTLRLYTRQIKLSGLQYYIKKHPSFNLKYYWLEQLNLTNKRRPADNWRTIDVHGSLEILFIPNKRRTTTVLPLICRVKQ